MTNYKSLKDKKLQRKLTNWNLNKLIYTKNKGFKYFSKFPNPFQIRITFEQIMISN